jgi:glycosyltransferase involved in cell wall biosynthesis
MRVGLNLLYLIPSVVGGTETYARSLISALAGEDGDAEYVVFVNAEAADMDVEPAPNFRRVRCRVRASRRPLRYAWEQLVLPLQVVRHRLDVLHSLGYVGPLACPCRHAVTIHDLNYLRHTHGMPDSRRRALRFFVGHGARRADHVLTVSEFARGEIVGELGIPPERVTVTYNAPRTAARGEGSRDARSGSDIARRYGLPSRYALAFTSQSAHKNIDRLIDAFGLLAPSIPHALVLVGHEPAGSTLRARVAAAGLGDRVVFTGYVPDEHVLPLLGGADLFVFPSLYEGFGIPVLDAQSVGVPVACSSAGSLPEVAGPGALLFDPWQVDAIARAIQMCLADGALRDRLRRAGSANVARFSWEATARATVGVYRRLAAAAPADPAALRSAG